MTDTVAVALLTSIAALGGAVFSTVMTVWNRSKTDANRADVEWLRSRLQHGQNVRSTQWIAEFAAYQAIWKEIVVVRPLADKIVKREGEMIKLGVPAEWLGAEQQLDSRKEMTEKLVHAANKLMSAIHDNAPFYPASIRDAAHEAHKVASQLGNKNMAAITGVMQGNDIPATQAFKSESEALLLQLFQHTNEVEALIRERLAAVQVVDADVV